MKKYQSLSLTKGQIDSVVELLKEKKTGPEIAQLLEITMHQVYTVSRKFYKGEEAYSKVNWSIVACKVCGQTTNKKGSVSGGWYCKEHNRKERRSTRLTKNCQSCGKEFNFPASKERKYCSVDCYQKTQALTYTNTKCNFCGKRVKQGYVKKGHEHHKKYCNVKCYRKLRARKIVTVSCSFCGQKIEKKLIAGKELYRSYCNIDCFHSKVKAFPYHNQSKAQKEHRGKVKENRWKEKNQNT